MNKQIARVDILIDAAVEHIVAINNIMQVVANGDATPTAAQYDDIAKLVDAAKSCNELVQRRYIKPTIKVKHAKLTPDQIANYVADVKHQRQVSDRVADAKRTVGFKAKL
ncbi:hypothetical protein F-S17_0208 [Faustovirus]|nr:hypothetical protein F-S17_0208 [Faustovirus]